MIKKAVLPVAGLGTRFLPASKAIPKEMLPIIDKPLVQYAVEEAVREGINEIIFVTSPEKFSIKNHFKKNKKIESILIKSGKQEIAEKINNTLGIPGTKPISNKTADTGIQARDILNCAPICSAMSCLSETRVTIMAVEIASNNEGICATNPSPIESRTYVSAAVEIGKSY